LSIQEPAKFCAYRVVTHPYPQTASADVLVFLEGGIFPTKPRQTWRVCSKIAGTHNRKEKKCILGEIILGHSKRVLEM